MEVVGKLVSVVASNVVHRAHDVIGSRLVPVCVESVRQWQSCVWFLCIGAVGGCPPGFMPKAASDAVLANDLTQLPLCTVLF
jgi:hypothetical protein